MIRTLIADDDALLRAALRTMVDWEALGYTLVGDCTNGLQALDLMQRRRVDLLITDMKMPLLDGLGLIRRLREGSLLPVTLVLSGYDEYELVREAFRLGAHDYLLKGNLDTPGLTRTLTDLRKGGFGGGTAGAPAAPGPALAPGSYGVAVFAADDLAGVSARFGGDLKTRLDKPMLELVRQIPRVAGRATVRAAGPGQYELLWQVGDKARYPDRGASVRHCGRVGPVPGQLRQHPDPGAHPVSHHEVSGDEKELMRLSARRLPGRKRACTTAVASCS